MKAAVWVMYWLLLGCSGLLAQVSVQGELQPFHRVAIGVNGPFLSENTPSNPFLDYRLDVTFSQGGRNFRIPGHYAADGNAAVTGASSGNQWRAYFAPDQPGNWTYTVSFRAAPGIAVSDDLNAGSPLSADGATGNFTIGANTAETPDLRARGQLQYTGRRYFQFSGDSTVFLWVGPSSPENGLADADFDSTYGQNGAALIDWSAHTIDGAPTDPTWGNGKGNGILGAIHYLADEGMTGVSLLGMNAYGEGQNVWPWITPDERDRFDCSKLDQWERVLAHANRQGLVVRWILQEKENELLLDNGALGLKRKLYYREMVSRWGHLPGWVWDLGEENGLGDERQAEDAAYLFELDAYRHPILLNNPANAEIATYSDILGESPELAGASLRTNLEEVHASTLRWVEQSMALGQSWTVFHTDQSPAGTGILPQNNYPGATAPDNVVAARRAGLYGNLMAGGAGIGYVFGTDHVQNDQNCGDFRSRAVLWPEAAIAHQFFTASVDVVGMTPRDSLVLAGDAWCLAEPGQGYVVYARTGGTVTLQLEDSARYRVQWLDPRTGGAFQTGSVTEVVGPGPVNLGIAPSATDEDWLIWLRPDSGLVGDSSPQETAPAWVIFPNPTSQRLNIAGHGSAPQSASLFNMHGQLLRHWQFSGAKKQVVSVEGIPKGLYWIELRGNEGQVRKKLLVE